MSAHHHVAAAVHAHRTKAAATISHATTTAPRTPRPHHVGDVVVDTATGQKGVVLHGKTAHVQSQNPVQ